MGSVYTPDDAAIWMRGAQRCVIENCKFLGVGGYAARLSLWSSHNRILRNTIRDGGQGGVLLAGYETATQPSSNLIAGNVIAHCGRIWKHVAGVYVTTGSRNRIAYNTITDMPRYGISLKSFRAGSASHGNIVEYNRILRTNLETNDTGAIETLGRDREDSGNVIRFNLILDVVGLKTSPTGEMLTPFYTWGIYLDDYSSGTQVYGNIVARTVRGAIHVHLGRNNVFENNIIVDCPALQAGALAPNWSEWPRVLRKFHAVCFPGSPYFQRYPALCDYTDAHPEEMTGPK
jgi:parallel beta-helix repeat protein